MPKWISLTPGGKYCEVLSSTKEETEEEKQLLKETKKPGQLTVDGSQVLEEWAEKRRQRKRNLGGGFEG